MAISGMEQRNMLLVTSVSFWKPWGLGPLTPDAYLEYDDDGEMEQVDQLIVNKRRHSWAGYTSYMQAIATGRDSVKSEPAPVDGLKKCLDCSTAAQQSQANEILPERKQVRSEKKHSHATSSDLASNGQLLDSICSPGSTCSSGDSPASGGGGLPGPIGTVTTLMVRNLPYWLSQSRFLAEVDSCGYAGLYDYCYLPHDFAKCRNLGYGFLNFRSPEHASQFWQEWNRSRRFGLSQRKSAVKVSAAEVQGRDENMKKALSKEAMLVRNPGFAPAIFDN